MSILINLLPDTKQAKLKERRRKQLVSGVSIMVWIVCGGVIGLMAAYELGQKAIIAATSNQISDKKQQLQQVTGLVEALTAQQHSNSLVGLYGQRVHLTKFFEAYGEVNPGEVSISAMTVDAQNAMTVSGTGRTYAAVAKLARALEAAHVKVGTGAAESNPAYFTDVTISSVNSSPGVGVSFSMAATLASEVVSGNN